MKKLKRRPMTPLKKPPAAGKPAASAAPAKKKRVVKVVRRDVPLSGVSRRSNPDGKSVESKSRLRTPVSREKSASRRRSLRRSGSRKTIDFMLPPPSETVTVAVRVRPLIKQEIRKNEVEVWEIKGDYIVHKEDKPTGKPPLKFRFEALYGRTSETREIYEENIREMIYTAMGGYNGTIFAYGQTSSGKSYTILGTLEEPGIIPLAINDVFKFIKYSEDREFLLRASYVEIYKERVNDLLSPTNTNLKIVEDEKLGVVVQGVKEEVVIAPEQVMSILITGESHRHISANEYHDQSSRSHSVFRLVIESQKKGDESGESIISSLFIIDLAGSERNVSNTDKNTQAEAAHINKSLLTLGTIISRLSKGPLKEGEVLPYRNSKLTRLLKPALDGNSRVAVICNLSPARMNFEESVSTLFFAKRAKKIVKSTKIIKDDKSLLKKYRKKIDALREELNKAREEVTKKPGARDPKDDEEFIIDSKSKRERKLELQIEKLKKMILVSASVELKEEQKQSTSLENLNLRETFYNPEVGRALRMDKDTEHTKERIEKLKQQIKEMEDAKKSLKKQYPLLKEELATLKDSISLKDEEIEFVNLEKSMFEESEAGMLLKEKIDSFKQRLEKEHETKTKEIEERYAKKVAQVEEAERNLKKMLEAEIEKALKEVMLLDIEKQPLDVLKKMLLELAEDEKAEIERLKKEYRERMMRVYSYIKGMT